MNNLETGLDSESMTTEAESETTQHSVAIVYPFFMHYREPVFREFIENGQHRYVFVGDTQDRKDGIEAYSIKPSERFWPVRSFYLGPMLLQPGLIWVLLTKKIDCLILLGIYGWPFTWVAAILGRLTGKRVLFWTHGWIKKEVGWKGWLRITFYRLAHGALLYGHRAKKIGIESGFPPDKLYVVYNALDYAQQQSLRGSISNSEIQSVHQLFENPELPIVICSSRLTKVRRLDLLFEAAATLAKQNHPINVLLIGEGPEKEFLQELAQQQGLTVCFFGACYDERKLAAMTMASKVTVAPGKVGLTAMQSLAYGTPVITHGDGDHQMPEYEAIEPGVSGDFFERNNVVDLARVIKIWTDKAKSKNVEACTHVIEQRYNPVVQRQLFDLAVSGKLPSEMPFQEPLA